MKKFFMALIIIILLSACNKINPDIEQNKNDLETQGSTKLLIVIDEWAPYTSKNLEEYGMVSKIVDLAMEEAGLEYEIQFKPWSRTLEMVKYGDAWGSFPWFYTEERAKYYYYSEPIMTSDALIFYKKTNDIISNPNMEINSIIDLKAYKFGGVFGYFYESDFKNDKDFKYDLSSNLESAFKLLDTEKVDILIEDEVSGWYLISELFPERKGEFGTFKNKLSTNKYYMIVTKEDELAEQKIKAFNKGLNMLKQTGEYEKILNSYK